MLLRKIVYILSLGIYRFPSGGPQDVHLNLFVYNVFYTGIHKHNLNPSTVKCFKNTSLFIL